MSDIDKKLRFNTVMARMHKALEYFDSPGYTLEDQDRSIPVWNSLLKEYRDLINELNPSDEELERGFEI